MKIRAVVFATIKETHEIEADGGAYEEFLAGRVHNDDRLREFLVQHDSWPDSFSDETLIEAEPYGEDLDRVKVTG